MRCTYCREDRPPDAFTAEGDHVVPASLGGAWVDPKVCRRCNERANEVADELIAKDFLVRFLRARYRIPDRYGKHPSPPVVALRLNGGGVIKATLNTDGPTFDAGVPPSVAEALELASSADQESLRRIFTEALRGSPRSHEPLDLARAAQVNATPPTAWSRFMAKVGLACGREAYGDEWLDSRQARTLSADLLGSGAPRFMQRTHHPPVAPSWPYVPPNHQLWIQPHKDTAILMVALFGQVLGAVPVNDLPADGDPTAWSLDSQARTFYRSTYPAIWLGHAARRIQEAGGTPLIVAHPEHPFVYTPDGPDGPIELGVQTVRADSPTHAFEILRNHRQER